MSLSHRKTSGKPFRWGMRMNGTNLYLGKQIPNQSMAIIRRWNRERGRDKGQFLCPGGFQNGRDRIRKGDRDRYRGDTEKLEQKREERKALPVEELTVPEQIERKEEGRKEDPERIHIPAIDTFKSAAQDRPISRIRSTGRQRSSCSRRSRTSAWA